jgi:hypothetical protein
MCDVTVTSHLTFCASSGKVSLRAGLSERQGSIVHRQDLCSRGCLDQTHQIYTATSFLCSRRILRNALHAFLLSSRILFWSPTLSQGFHIPFRTSAGSFRLHRLQNASSQHSSLAFLPLFRGRGIFCSLHKITLSSLVLSPLIRTSLPRWTARNSAERQREAET